MVTLSPVLPIHSQILPGHNQETYQRLQSALQTTPPHQLWVAVCDDLPLQRQLAATLEASLQAQGAIASAQLIFAADEPDLVQQLQDWASTSPYRNLQLLQILGIEQLTYRGADQQYQFLRSLSGLLPVWQQLGCSLLIWLPRPWLKQVKRVVPTLCKTVFEFMGEPTPLSVIGPDQPHQATFTPIRQWQFWERPEADSSEAEPDVKPSAAPAQSTTIPVIPAAAEPEIAEAEAAEPETAAAAETGTPTFSEELWHHLQADLTQLENPESPFLLPPSATHSEALPPALDSADASETEIPTAAPATDQEGHPAVTEMSYPPVADFPASETQPEQQSETQLSDRTRWAMAYALRDRVQAGDCSPETLQAAIQQYENLPVDAPSTPHRTEVLNDLGSLYWLWAQQTPDVETYHQRLLHSCGLYEAALSPISPGTGAEILTRLHSNLGSAYSLLAVLQSPAQYLGKAVRAFHRALQYTPAEILPMEYATLQTHLGTAYWSLAQHTHEAAHLHRAIAAYQEALCKSPPQQVPQTYAQLQNNLGIALWSLSRHERPVFLLEQAVTAYQNALAYRTLDTDPAGCAATHNNLGTAYWDLGGYCPAPSSEQIQAWQRAIAAYEAALSAAAQVSPGTLGFDLWATHHSVGVVYDQLAITLAPDTAAQHTALTQALNHYVQALTGWQALEAATVETAFQAIVRNLHLQAQYLGIEEQQRSLSQIPADWLPDIWRKL